ncbi:Predicted esterase [Rhizobiales bacterium GAS191]|nr:Predicted esterase [Rhizobiales bacterium GAS191]
MAWMQFSRGLRLDPVIRPSPEALVILLQDHGTSAATLAPVAASWATSVPGAAFVALDGFGQFDPLSSLDPDANVEPLVLDRVTQHLEPLLGRQLRSYRLDASRLVLVGFGYGGTLALHMVLRRGLGCAGVLAFGAKVMRPLPRIVRVDQKLRLIACAEDGDMDHSSLREVVALLTKYGIDTRAALLPGAALSDQAIRHGGAYLVELVATAQRGDRFHLDRESSHAQ